MAQAVILMTASRGCSILGSGTVSIRTSPFPCQQSARMIFSSKTRPPTCEVAKRSVGTLVGAVGCLDEFGVPQIITSEKPIFTRRHIVGSAGVGLAASVAPAIAQGNKPMENEGLQSRPTSIRSPLQEAIAAVARAREQDGSASG